MKFILLRSVLMLGLIFVLLLQIYQLENRVSNLEKDEISLLDDLKQLTEATNHNTNSIVILTNIEKGRN